MNGAVDKPALRRKVMAARDALTRDEIRDRSLSISESLTAQPEFMSAMTVLMYVSFRSEVSTRRMIEVALAQGKRVLVPKVDRKARWLKLYEIKDLGSDLQTGYMGIYEPVEGVARHAEASEADLIVMPGVGFDIHGGRLGYGGGYYDRLLETTRQDAALVALAFELQIVDEIPTEPHDKKVDKIITETKVITA